MKSKNIFINVLLVLFSLLASELVLRLAGMFYLSFQNTNFKLSGDQLRILTLGESTTAFGLSNSYPSLLEKEIKSKIGIPVKVVNKGIPGTFLSVIKEQLESNLKVYKPNIVIVMAGINDFLYGKEFSSKNSWYEDLRLFKLLKLIKINSSDAKELDFFDSFSRLDTNLKAMHGKSFEQSAFNYISNATKPSDIELLLSKIDATKDYKLYEEIILRSIKRCFEVSSDNRLECYKMTSMLSFIKFNHNKPFISKVFEESYQNGFYFYSKRNMASLVSSLFCEVGNKAKCDYYSEEHKKLFYNELTDLKSLFDKMIIDDILPSVNQVNDEQVTENMIKYLQENERVGSKYAIYKLNLFACSKKFSICNKKININPAKDLYENKVILNYLKNIQSTIKRYGAVLVVMGYPSVSIKILEDKLSDGNTIFVENKSNFKDALKKYDYAELFSDRFGMSFGHATAKGNKVIVSNLMEKLRSLFITNKN